MSVCRFLVLAGVFNLQGGQQLRGTNERKWAYQDNAIGAMMKRAWIAQSMLAVPDHLRTSC
jgi:hypothetical protein